jgi:hypothetical protein
VFTWYRHDLQQNPHPYRLYYYRLEDTDDWDWEPATELPWKAFTYSYEINCWLPTIDVGMVDLGDGADWGVGVAFTAQDLEYDNMTIPVYCVVGNGWYVDDDGDQTGEGNLQVLAPDGYHSCGMPSIGIGYYSVGQFDPWWAIAYVQALGEDPWYDVMFIDSVNNDPQPLTSGIYDTDMKFGPAVTCHCNPLEQVASVSAYRDNGSGAWQPCAANFDVGSEDWSTGFTSVQTDLPDIDGDFIPATWVFTDPGIATSIVSSSDAGNYYMGFSTRVDMDEYNCEIWAAYGNTTE